MAPPFPAPPLGAAPPEAPRSSFVAVGVTLVLAIAGIAGVSYAMKREPPPYVPPEPMRDETERPPLEPTGNTELDTLLREAQESLRAAESNLRRAEDHGKRVESDLAEALRRKVAADRAKAEFDAAHPPAMGEPAPTPTGM